MIGMKKGRLAIIIILVVVIVGGAFLAVIYRQRYLEAKPCDTTDQPFEYTAAPNDKGPAPDTYLVKVSIETTSLTTYVEVDGIQSMTVADYTVLNEVDPQINIQVEGLESNEISRPETNAEVLPRVAVEFEAVVQPAGDTATFRISKGNSGTVIYKLYSVAGNSTKEVARFIHDGIVQEGENIRTFNFDLDLLSAPLDLPGAGESYDGPLFDAHLHLVGTDGENFTRAKDDKLFINPRNASKFFALMEKQGVIGMIGFLPAIHEFFIGDGSYNRSYQKQTLRVVKRCDNKLTPFLYPYSHIGIPPKQHSNKLPQLIEQNTSGNLISFKGIGELHTGPPQTDTYAGMRLTDPAMLELYDHAAENNLVIMIHPEVGDRQDLREALRYNPKTIFLLHGGEGIEKFLPTLFREHENLYFSLDTNLLYPYSITMAGMTKKEFLNNLRSTGLYYRLLASALQYWKPLIESHPDRIMWGTDALYTWHFEPEVYSEVTWFARDFIGGLSPEVQDRYGYKNAERLLSR